MNNKIIAGLVIAIVIIGAAIYMLVPIQMPISTECVERQVQLNQQADQLNYCTVTEDCEVQALFCPFECWVFANKNADFSQVKVQINAYGNECGVCELACPSTPPKPECIAGKCVVT